MGKSIKILLSIFSTLLVGSYLLFTNAASLITVSSRPPLPPQYIAILMGDTMGNRAMTAHKTVAVYPKAKVLLAKSEAGEFEKSGIIEPNADQHKQYLIRQGIPESQIEIISCGATSTFEEADCLKSYLQNNNENSRMISLLLVTHWYHSFRALWLFNRVFDGSNTKIFMNPTHIEKDQLKNWWKYEDSFLAVYTEYLKVVYWFLNYQRFAAKLSSKENSGSQGIR